MSFKSMKEVHEAFNYPDSFQNRRVLYDKEGVIRIYCCESVITDVVKSDSILFWIPVEMPHIRESFEKSRASKRSIRCFTKTKPIIDLGCWYVVKTDVNYVKLKPTL